MGTWRKAPQIVIDRFFECLPNDYGVEPRKMFGYPCAFVNGNMFTGVHQENIILRLGKEERATFLTLPGSSQFEPMAGRPMREYVVAPPAMNEDAAVLKDWMARSLAYTAALPPKEKKEKSARTRRTSRRT